MTYTFEHLLTTEATHRLNPSWSGGVNRFLPANGWVCERAELLTFEFRYVKDSASNPTTMVLGMTPMVAATHTSGMQRTRPSWLAVKPADIGITVLRGDTVPTDPSMVVLATEATTTQTVLVSVPVKKFTRFRFRFELTYAGSAPSIPLGTTLFEMGE